MKVPSKVNSKEELKELQRSFAEVVFRPLNNNLRTQRKWKNGKPTAEVVDKFITKGPHLTPLERIELYNRQYWFRLIDSFYEDFPGIRALIGPKKFYKFTLEYLQKNPSKSYTLRNVGQFVADFVKKNPSVTAPHTKMIYDMARFEWAMMLAFEAPRHPAPTSDELLGKDPSKLYLKPQPFLYLMECSCPVDEVYDKISKEFLRSEASNAVAFEDPRDKKILLKKKYKETIYIAVYQYNFKVRYRRLQKPQYKLLQLLAEGKSLAKACEAVINLKEKSIEEWAKSIQEWFTESAQLGWYYLPKKK